MSTGECPACLHGLDFLPWDGDLASHEICPFCGIHFGYNDAHPDLREGIYSGWRQAWLANGQRPFAGEAWSKLSTDVVRRAKEDHDAG
jgi:hypothetical protein